MEHTPDHSHVAAPGAASDHLAPKAPTWHHSNATPRVLHIVWNLIRGGTEGQCARVVMGLAERGWNQRVAAFRREGFFFDDVEKVCGSVHHIDIRRFIEPHTIAEILRLKNFILQESFDVVHAWDADAEIFGSVAARWAGISYITSRRDLGDIYPSYKLWLMTRADRRAQKIVVNAEAIRDYVVGLGMPLDKIAHITNILDLEEFDRLANEPSDRQLPDGPKIAMVARLDPEKDVATLLRAFKLLCSKFPNHPIIQSSNLQIAGDGPERSNLEALTDQLGIRERVDFLGDITDVPALLKLSDIGVLVPNSNEGLSNTILEYMAAALPVVATDCGGNEELVRDGENGYIVPIGDERALSERLAGLLENSDRRKEMGVAGRTRIEDEFGKECILDQFQELYRSLV